MPPGLLDERPGSDGAAAWGNRPHGPRRSRGLQALLPGSSRALSYSGSRTLRPAHRVPPSPLVGPDSPESVAASVCSCCSASLLAEPATPLLFVVGLACPTPPSRGLWLDLPAGSIAACASSSPPRVICATPRDHSLSNVSLPCFSFPISSSSPARTLSLLSVFSTSCH